MIPVYILTDSGEWFRLNELHGEGWCLHFDPQEPPLIVVTRRRGGFLSSVGFPVSISQPIPRAMIPDGTEPAKFSPPGVLLHFGDHEAAERFAAESEVKTT